MSLRKIENGSIEQRTFTGVELRAESQGDELALAGYACSFNQLSRDLGGFREQVAPGAFKRSIERGDDCKALLNHDPNNILGRRKNNTLKVSEDERGLKFRCVLDSNQQAHRDIHASVKRGDIDECSFSFRVPPQGDMWDEANDENGQRFIRRTLLNVDLYDVSAVVYPAYDSPGSTEVQARAADYSADAARRSRVAAIGAMLDKERRDRFARISSELKAETRKDDDCECDCENCRADDCENCQNRDCDDPNCEDCPFQKEK